ncbi:invasin [Salmonella enterica subsp. diarizonae]|uniref:inverse autotransporter beta domain-containing protein n=1 Tax=Salmonella enterica TaxID=28901 RepID=UPI0009AC4F3A|nr:inverse autotransporter beta domain-containing protein [Salmonella enterica]EDL8432105.1 invasin [Salmonella enterica subsp. diarizonae]
MKRSRSSHPPADTAFSPGLRRLAWLNIAVQAAFPLVVAFTPVMAGAGEQHFLLQPAPLSAQRTQVYTLGAGETAASVAKKFHLTLDQLREINQLRTFAHGLNGLQSGDTVDVPLMTAKDKKTVSGTSTASPSTAGTSASVPEGDEQAQKVAGYASQAGSFLAGSAKSDAAVSMARGMVTGEVGGALQQWLSHFGTARVQLDADKNFSLKNSQFDLLMPLYDHGDNLVFTQGSLHRTDGRTQANLGAGLRHYMPGYMLGGNLFGDYDLSREHARMGAGLEYWRDFLKLGVNGYYRLTDWKDSPDLTEYQERPANGLDIRVQAWVPSLPQLGGKLTYEQYYGKEVALFGVDSRQKNPHAITAGINYTPVPLITLGAEQRQGQSGKSDSRLTVDMNYQLGVPWGQQVDPDAVAAMRTLTGSRYDLVERNNNIVLEYRKKDTIRLKTADLVTGYAGEQKSLDVSVTSKYGLARIDWDAAALNAAGGKIVQSGTDYAVVLPAYQTTMQAVNIYTVSGVAVDTKGNRSERSDTQVTVQAQEVNKQSSTFTPVSSVLPADGKSTQVLTLTLRDENNQPVDMDVKGISLNRSALKSATVSALTRQSAGVYTVTVTAGTDVETVTLTPSVNGITLSPAGVTISSVTPDQAKSGIKTDATTYVSGADMAVTVTLKDAQDNAVTGAAASLTADTVTVPNATLKTGSSWKDNGDGTYTATYTATTAGTGLKATVKLSGWSSAASSEAYAITAEDEAPASINTQVNPYTFTQTSEEGTFPTTGFTGATFTVVPKDNKNASDYTWKSDTNWVSVADGVVTFTGTGTGSKVTITGKPTSGQGKIIKYSFTLKSWFINNGSTTMNWSDANTYCSSQSGYSQPTAAQMSLHNNYSATMDRGTGALWNEWGNLTAYASADFLDLASWSSELRSSSNHYLVDLHYGNIISSLDFIPNRVACRQGL